MTHALGSSHLGRHSGYHQHSAHPGGWWKSGLVALAAIGIGIGLVRSPLFEKSPTAQDALGQPAMVFLSTEVAPMAPVLPPETSALVAPSVTVPTESSSAAAAQVPAPLAAAPIAVPVQARDRGIREVDLATLPAILVLARQVNGRFDKAQVVYADVTNDGAEDAIVPITSDGTYGNLAYAVLTVQTGNPKVILTRFAGRERRGLVLTYDRSQLAETSGVYGPTDPNCCPSQLVKTYYRWNGTALLLDRTETIDIPQGPKAD